MSLIVHSRAPRGGASRRRWLALGCLWVIAALRSACARPALLLPQAGVGTVQMYAESQGDTAAQPEDEFGPVPVAGAPSAAPPAAQQGPAGGEAYHSTLLGPAGVEGFEPGARMFDPSYAGYGQLEVQQQQGLGPPATVLSVLDFGAVPDDGKSDSAALAAAIEAAPEAALTDDGPDGQFTIIYFPAGEYLLTTNLTISKPIVLRGAGKDATRIRWDKSLSELYPDAKSPNPSAPNSAWSFRRMLLDFQGQDSLFAPEDRLADVAQPTAVGSRLVSLSSTQGIWPGMVVRLVATDPGDLSLIRYLYGEGEPGAVPLDMDLSDHLKNIQAGNLEGEDARDPIRFVSRVAQVLPDSNQIELERAVPYALQLAWAPRVMRFRPRLQHVGVEGLTFVHPWEVYRGHFQEAGHNTLGFSRVSNCWVKDVRILNADSAVGLEYVHFATLEDVELGVTADRSKCCDMVDQTAISCHHGISMGHSTDVLVNRLQHLVRCIHDVSIDWWVSSSVVANTVGIDLNIDFHRSGAHGNLVSNVTCGICSAPFWSSGSQNRGLHAGMKNTFWNYRLPDAAGYEAAAALVRAQTPPDVRSPQQCYEQQQPAAFDLPSPQFGPWLNFVGVSATLDRQGPANQPGERVTQDLMGTWLIEDISPETRARLQPQDVWAALREARLARQLAGRQRRRGG